MTQASVPTDLPLSLWLQTPFVCGCLRAHSRAETFGAQLSEWLWPSSPTGPPSPSSSQAHSRLINPQSGRLSVIISGILAQEVGQARL